MNCQIARQINFSKWIRALDRWIDRQIVILHIFTCKFLTAMISQIDRYIDKQIKFHRRPKLNFLQVLFRKNNILASSPFGFREKSAKQKNKNMPDLQYIPRYYNIISWLHQNCAILMFLTHSHEKLQEKMFMYSFQFNQLQSELYTFLCFCILLLQGLCVLGKSIYSKKDQSNTFSKNNSALLLTDQLLSIIIYTMFLCFTD